MTLEQFRDYLQEFCKAEAQAIYETTGFQLDVMTTTAGDIINLLWERLPTNLERLFILTTLTKTLLMSIEEKRAERPKPSL